MTNPETKSCRHCGEPILTVARVCKHCRSNQGWFSNQKDPRYLWVLLPVVLLAVMQLLCVAVFILAGTLIASIMSAVGDIRRVFRLQAILFFLGAAGIVIGIVLAFVAQSRP